MLTYPATVLDHILAVRRVCFADAHLPSMREFISLFTCYKRWWLLQNSGWICA